MSKLDRNDHGMTRKLDAGSLLDLNDPLLAIFNRIEMSVVQACGELAASVVGRRLRLRCITTT